MTPQERRAEASALGAVFHAALTALGLRAMADAVRLWAGVSSTPSQVSSTGSRWLAEAISLVSLRRRHARQLAFAYYRLIRALHVGKTLPPLEGESGRQTTLSALRRDFYAAVAEYAPEVLEGAEIAPDEVPDRTEDFGGVQAPSGAGDLDVLIEEIDGLIEELDRLDELTEEEARTVLEALGLKNLERKLDEIDDKLSSSELDARREEARLKVARRQAAAVDRLVQNGARGDLWVTAEKDREVLAYARVSRTGTPCGWCAMLISRGPVYKTAGAATFGLDGEGDRYHDNCHCYAEPVFSLEQYEQDSRFDLNREYSRLWPRVTSGLSGKAALSAWRKHFRESQSS